MERAPPRAELRECGLHGLRIRDVDRQPQRIGTAALAQLGNRLVEQILAASQHRHARPVLGHTLCCGTPHTARTTRYGRCRAAPSEIHAGPPYVR
jgi:hypothetical protein